MLCTNLKILLFSTLSLLLLFFPNSRVGQRGAGLSATIARSEHEISEIIDGLSEQEVRLLSILCYRSITNDSISLSWQLKVSFKRFVFLRGRETLLGLVWESLCELWLEAGLRNTSRLWVMLPNCICPRFFLRVCFIAGVLQQTFFLQL